MKYVKLKDIAAISAGQRAPQGNDFCLEGTPFVKAGNLRELTEGKQIKDIQRVSDNVAKEYGLRLYPKGTILFAKSGMSCLKGYVYVLPEDAYVVSHLACITPYNEISDYLRYYFIYNRNRPNRLVKDISYPSISLSDIGNIRIDLKSKDERNEIVSLLDKTTCAISLLNKELQMLDYLTKARFVEMFGDPVSNPYGWDKVNISTVVRGRASNGYFAKRQEYVEDGNVAILGVAHVVNRMYSQVEGLPGTNASDVDIQKHKVGYGDMLFCRSSLVAEGIGKASIVPENTPDNTLFECHVIRLPLNLNKCIPEYM